MNKIQLCVATLGGIIVSYFERYALIYWLVAGAIIFDLATGVVAAARETGLSSKIARDGFLKKVMLLVSVAFGTYLDYMLARSTELVGFEFNSPMLFSSVICIYICISECISIIENIYRVTGGAIPQWIAKLLKQHKDSLEKGGDGNGSK